MPKDLYSWSRLTVMATFQARFTIVSMSGDYVSGGMGWRMLGGSAIGPPGVFTFAGTIIYAISKVDGFSFDGGMNWGPAPAGFLADGSSFSTAASLGFVSLGGSHLPYPLDPTKWFGNSQVTWVNFSNSPVINAITVNTPPAITSADSENHTDGAIFESGLLTVADLIQQLVLTVSIGGQGGGGLDIAISDQAPLTQNFKIQGDYEIRNKLVSVSFGNGRDIRFDDNSADYDKPHWRAPEE